MTSPSDLYQRVEARLQRYLPIAGDKPSQFLVAFSGGIDSTVLLWLATKFAKQHQVAIHALHVNHNISVNAALWQRHCIDVCAHLDVPLTIKSVEVAAHGKGFEAAAREARYAAIAELASDSTLVLLGQHQNDQVETGLLQLLRGAGPQGVSGMAEYSVNQFRTKLVRPFLNMTRSEIEHYAEQHQLNWIDDESNRCDDYDRNFLRNKVLPLLSERWPEMTTTISRSMTHIREQNQLLSESVVSQLEQVRTVGGRLDIAKLRQLSLPWQKQLLKHWFSLNDAQQPSQSVLLRIINDCLYARDDAQPEVKWGHWQCCRYNDELYLLKQSVKMPEMPIPLRLQAKLEVELVLPEGGGKLVIKRQSTDTAPSNTMYLSDDVELVVTFGGFSRRFRPKDKAQSKPISQWFKEWRIPPWERQKTPIVQWQNEVLAVGDRIAKQRQQDGLAAFTISWQPGF